MPLNTKQHIKKTLMTGLLWLTASLIHGQSIDLATFGKGQALQLSGSISANTVYLNTNRPGAWQNFTYFLQGSLNLKLYQFSMPVSYSFTNQGNNLSYRIPFNFNRLSIHPKYKWIQAHIGDANMNFSPYTLNGHQFTGGGLELSLPKNFKVSLMAGQLLKAVEDDDNARTIPAFKRMGYGLKVGYTHSKYAVKISSFYAKDDINSLKKVPEAKNVLPKENLAVSLETNLKIVKNLSLNLIYASSAITQDLRTGKKTGAGQNISGLLFNNRTSTEYYTAFKTELSYLIQKTKVGLSYEHIDPGYQTLGAYYFNNDLENVTLNATKPMFNNKMNLTFNLGYQRDNLDFSKLLSTNRMVGSANLQYHPNQKLNITASYSNFSTYTNQKLNRLETVNQIDVTPEQLQQTDYKQLSQNTNVNVNWLLSQSKTKTQNLNFNYSLASSSNAQGGVVHIGQANNFHNANTSYTLGLPGKKMNITASVNYTYNDIYTNNSQGWGSNLNLSKKLFDDKLNTAFGLGYNTNNNNNLNTNILTANLRLSLNLKGHNFNLSAVNLFRNIETKDDINEFRVNFGYTYSLDFLKKKGKKKTRPITADTKKEVSKKIEKKTSPSKKTISSKMSATLKKNKKLLQLGVKHLYRDALHSDKQMTKNYLSIKESLDSGKITNSKKIKILKDKEAVYLRHRWILKTLKNIMAQPEHFFQNKWVKAFFKSNSDKINTSLKETKKESIKKFEIDFLSFLNRKYDKLQNKSSNPK